MPTYEIEQYELHAMKYRVKAKSEAEAIVKLVRGEAESVEQSQDMIEVADDYALPVDEYPELAAALRKLGELRGKDEIIPSIRSIEDVGSSDAEHDEEQTPDVSRWRNYYRCPECGHAWQDEWDCQCNDRCPGCNKEIEPYKSEPASDDSGTP